MFFVLPLTVSMCFVCEGPRVGSSSQCEVRLLISTVIMAVLPLVLNVLSKYPINCLHFPAIFV